MTFRHIWSKIYHAANFIKYHLNKTLTVNFSARFEAFGTKLDATGLQFSNESNFNLDQSELKFELRGLGFI